MTSDNLNCVALSSRHAGSEEKVLFERIGGRARDMIHLRSLAADTGIGVPAFAIIDADTIAPLEKNERPEGVGLVEHQDSLPVGLNDTWNAAKEPLSSVLQPLLSQLPTEIGFPVLKCSHIANSEPHHLSFAGVGVNVKCKEANLLALAEACIELLRARYRGYAIYYRQAHPTAACLDVAVLGMQHLPPQRVWGTVWGSINGFVMTCSREDIPVRKYTSFMKLLDGSAQFFLPDWLQSVEGLDTVCDLITYWCQSGLAGAHFDVEFCIAFEGKPWLTQWRPLPDRQALLLDATLKLGPDTLGPTPFSQFFPITGSLRFAHSLPQVIEDLTDQIASSSDEIWVIPYSSRDVDLFRLLVAAHSRPGLLLPPLLVLHDRLGPLGHLHAIAPEDPRVSMIVHLYSWNMKYLSQGDFVQVCGSTGINHIRRKTFVNGMASP